MNKVTIALDENRELKFSINAMVEFEQRFDKALPELFQLEKMGFGTMLAMLTIALKYGGMKIPGRTPDDQEKFVGDLVQQHWIDQGKTVDEYMAKVNDALNAAGIFNASEDKPENPKQGTGG